MNHRHSAFILVTASVTLPGVFLRLAGIHLEPVVTAAISGAAIAAAAFLLLWACDAAQTEISQALALAAVALMAVLPEYSIDMYFTWQAGRDATGTYAQYAVANMTGANRLLIGVGLGRHRADLLAAVPQAGAHRRGAPHGTDVPGRGHCLCLRDPAQGNAGMV